MSLRRLRRVALAALLCLALAVLAALIHLHAPPCDPLPPVEIDLCAARRPDGTLPAACAGTTDGDATLLFAGDTAEVDAALPVIEAEGLDYPFGETAAIVGNADFALANLEAPLTDAEGGDRFSPWRKYVYRAPPNGAGAIARAGFDGVGLANNHTMDYGARGLGDTVRALARAEVVSVGAGAGEAEARRAVIVKMGSLRVGVLSRCEWQLAWDFWVGQYARGTKPGVALLEDERLAADIARLRPLVDLVVVSVHWGENYSPPTRWQMRWAHRLAEMGADLVVGHHPHVAQPVLLDGRTPILLSLGNYAFGTPGDPRLGLGLLARVTVVGRRIARLELLPLDVQNRRVRFRPIPLVGAHAREMLAPIASASRALGTPIEVTSGDDGVEAVLLIPPRSKPLDAGEGGR